MQTTVSQIRCHAAGHQRTVDALKLQQRTPSQVRRLPVKTCCTGAPSLQRPQRGGPTGLDVVDENGKVFRPTSKGGWEVISKYLQSKEVQFISPQEVLFAQERGVPIVDVRPEAEFKKGHILGSYNVEYYRLIQGWDAWSVMRRVGFTFFGVVGTEPNPDFLEQVQSVEGSSEGVILVCNLGGHLDEYGPSEFGWQSRSLMAAYELFTNDMDSISVMKGGMNEWKKSRDVYLDEE